MTARLQQHKQNGFRRKTRRHKQLPNFENSNLRHTCLDSSYAAASPAHPAPMTTTFFLLSPSGASLLDASTAATSACMLVCRSNRSAYLPVCLPGCARMVDPIPPGTKAADSRERRNHTRRPKACLMFSCATAAPKPPPSLLQLRRGLAHKI